MGIELPRPRARGERRTDAVAAIAYCGESDDGAAWQAADRAPISRGDDRATSRGRARWLPVSEQDELSGDRRKRLTVGVAHDVSIRIAIGAGVGRCLGSQPRSKVSMTSMRPPQHGQGRGSVRGSSVRPQAPRLGFGRRRRAPSNSRALRDGCGAIAVGEQAVVADAVEALRQHVHQEAPDELVRRERHGLPAGGAVDAIVLPAEGDAVIVGGERGGGSRWRRGGCSGTDSAAPPRVPRTAPCSRRPTWYACSGPRKRLKARLSARPAC